jgi:hypothetical protein
VAQAKGEGLEVCSITNQPPPKAQLGREGCCPLGGKMNKQRRKKLAEICDELTDLIVEEQEAFDNMPESIQLSERGEAFEEAVQAMEAVIVEIEQIIEG